ncbi:hypothetical protein [Spirosoma koreense]
MRFIHVVPGFYQYTYPTFADTPQQLCIHFLTPDKQWAFVSYPNHPQYRAAELVSLSWFRSIRLQKLAGYPCLMHFLEITLPRWLGQAQMDFALEELLTDRLVGRELMVSIE